MGARGRVVGGADVVGVCCSGSCGAGDSAGTILQD